LIQLASIKHKQFQDSCSQTKLSLTNEIANLEEALKSSNEQLETRLSTIQELETIVNQMTTEREEMLDKLAKKESDLEVALVNERSAKSKIVQQVELMKDLEKEIANYRAVIKDMKDKLQESNRENSELRIIMDTEEKLRNMKTPSIDPVTFLQQQWDKERQKICTENTLLREKAQFLIMKNQEIKKELMEKTTGLPTPAEYSETLIWNNIDWH
jgi:chromosome segregation ATPase